MSGWNYIAQRATTGEFLSMELPLTATPKWALSGTGFLTGTIAPDLGRLRASDGWLLLEEWGTLIFAEADGIIRWGGIVISSEFDGPEWKVVAAEFSTYPHGMPYGGSYSQIGVDPASVVRHLWEHLQSHPDGNLGVTVVGSTPVRIGTDPEDVSFTTGAGTDVAFRAGPYELNWWESPDIGREISALSNQTPFDFVEQHRWNADRTDIHHEIVIGYPRAGRRRSDLSFIQGDNVTSVVTPELDGDEFANEVVGLGAGEGAGAVRRNTAVRDGRLRRVYVYSDKGVSSVERMDALIRDELTVRQRTLSIDSITVREHPNAPIGSWALGDDIRVQATVPWLGEVELWCRITAWELTSEHTATLSLARSDSFVYGG
ncbi:hypothetical protein [Mycetocola miduiensis]|uniref:Minor tail protein n=1 Tax=Mycetocola miduiensis TaxID=995034 RepID=A0A1I5AU00_9MICO|nr:hypothetical protein [Mycetocola miduiensis]SFN66006.1 hypothetical protein SAMN05216219_1544 [Mycetocola miduiensis]